jgi:hypothetical protein
VARSRTKATWLLAVGRWLHAITIAQWELSDILGTEVQYFATNRVAERHIWQRAATAS